MSAPDTPDFGAIAVGQGEENREVVNDQIYANRPDQYTPWGYNKWTNEQVPDGMGGTTTKWTQTQGLSPEQQKQYDQQQAINIGKGDVAGGLVGRMGSEFGAPIDWSGQSPMGGVPEAQYTRPGGGVGDPYETRRGAEDAMYNQAMSRVQPAFEAKRASLETKMRNQGLGPEDAAWKSQMTSLDQQETDAGNQAQWSASEAGRAESGQMFNQQMGRDSQDFSQNLSANQQNFGQGMSQSAYANQIRQQQMTEEMQKRGFSLNEINALMSGQQIQNPSMPNFSQGAAAAPAPIYQGAVDTSNADQAAYQSKISGVTDLAGAGMGAWGSYLGAGK